MSERRYSQDMIADTQMSIYNKIFSSYENIK